MESYQIKASEISSLLIFKSNPRVPTLVSFGADIVEIFDEFFILYRKKKYLDKNNKKIVQINNMIKI